MALREAFFDLLGNGIAIRKGSAPRVRALQAATGTVALIYGVAEEMVNGKLQRLLGGAHYLGHHD